jgi:hypothetical protein
MAGLLDQAGKLSSDLKDIAEESHKVWEESMLRSIEVLRESIIVGSPHEISLRCNADYVEDSIRLEYWGELTEVDWPSLEMRGPNDKPLSTFDRAMLMYYLKTADGTKMADRWIGFRELPDGGFYNQAFQGYSGNRLARVFGDKPDNFTHAAISLDGTRLPALAEHAFAFQPLPCIRLAAILWPGDEELPTKASVLFDASSSHYLPTDGLALLGSGLVRRLEKQLS